MAGRLPSPLGPVGRPPKPPTIDSRFRSASAVTDLTTGPVDRTNPAFSPRFRGPGPTKVRKDHRGWHLETPLHGVDRRKPSFPHHGRSGYGICGSAFNLH